MKTLEQARKNKLIKQAHAHLDIVEAEIKRIQRKAGRVNPQPTIDIVTFHLQNRHDLLLE